MTNTADLCQILVWTEERINKIKSHWKTIPTLQQDKKDVGSRNHGNFIECCEGLQGPLNQRS